MKNQVVNHPAFTLEDFITESNRIEGMGPAKPHEIDAHKYLLAAPTLTVPVLNQFVFSIASAQLRDKPGMNVRVGDHYPLQGGPEVAAALEDLLVSVVLSRSRMEARLFTVAVVGIAPHEAHVLYESLHPYMDGNGRSGRAIWLWHMGGIERAPLGFLHHFYYQTLQASRA